MRRVEKCTLKWKMKPVPSVYPCELLHSPSFLPTPQTLRNPSRQRFFQEDELYTFLENDTVSTLHDLNDKQVHLLSSSSKDLRIMFYTTILQASQTS